MPRRIASPIVQVDASVLGSLSAAHLLHDFGVVGVLVVLFLEMGVLVAFFLPGDSLLFVAGYATVAGNSLHFSLSLPWLIIGSVVGAVAGAQLGYELGRRAGPTLHQRESRIYKRDYVERAERFVNRFGTGKSVVIGRFLPIVRTFVSPLVGVAGMPRRDFVIWNLISGVVWTVPLILLGHLLGNIGFVRKYVEVLAVLIVVVSVVPAIVHYVRERRSATAA